MRWYYVVLLLTGILGLLLVAGCRTVPVQYDFASDQTAARESAQARPTVAPGSEAEQAAIERVKTLLGDLSTDNIRRLTRQVYAEEAYLNDTLKTLQGAEAIEAYFLETAEITDFIKATFADVSPTGDGFYVFRWQMDVGMRKVARGKTVQTLGISLIRFDEEGKVTYHQDYWDSTAGLFQHVPGIGRGIRMIKARL